MRPYHPVIVQQGEVTLGFQDSLNHEHDVWAAGVVFVKDNRAGVPHCPGQHAFAELGYLLAITQDDGVTANEVDPADVAVQVDAHQGPVQACGHLLDVR